ncbi:MAG: CC/Se motif family (seleno)protein [Acetobacterium sp.]|nr:CC/Se motif family (seleno)protein [Acetobacterium sp.]
MNNNFAIKIDDAVLKWMRKKRKKVLTLSVNTTGGGCCPTFEIVEIDMIEPDQTENFQLFKQNDITLYIGKNARVAAPTLHFKLKKNFIGATIQVEGLSLKRRDP